MQKKIALVFPGQGSQSVGMLKTCAEKYEIVEQLFSQASEILDYDIRSIVFDGPADKLNETIYTQPAMLISDVALWRIWLEEIGELPSIMAGHSFGEYAALVAAGAIDFKDAVELVVNRAIFMQETVPNEEGTMGVILALESHQVQAICDEISSASKDNIVQAVNFNAPGQTVIAGYKAAVEKALKIAKELGAKRAKLLAVSIPAHSELMRPAAEKFSALLNNTVIKMPKIPVIQNAGVQIFKTPEAIKEALVRQIYTPVQWVDTVRKMISEGIRCIVECGPDKILTSLHKRISNQLTLFTWNDSADFKTLRDIFFKSHGR